MNRSISLHPLSLVLGLVFGVLVLLSMSQVGAANHNVVVSYGPDPRDMVTIRGTTPYTVPPGKLLVLTGIGVVNGGSSNCFPVAAVNGSVDWPAAGELTVPAGSVVTLGFSSSGCSVLEPWLRASGYLAPQ